MTAEGKTSRRSFWEGAGVAALIALALALGWAGFGSQLAGSDGQGLSQEAVGPAEVEPADWGSASFDYRRDVPRFAGAPSVSLNGGVPFFAEPDFARGDEIELAELDDAYEADGNLGRAGAAFVTVGPGTLASGERGPLRLERQPSGWRQKKYADLLSDNYLYNRCHLAAWSLVGNAVELDDVRNLVTGTRYMNASGMEPFERQVLAYVRSTGNHVIYRATPVFEGGDLLARGVLVEAASIEDRDGPGSLRVCAWCYNVQPGISIDYATGESEVEGGAEGTGDALADGTYLLNTSSKVFHLPGCPTGSGTKESNREYSDATRDELIGRGYRPCGNCNP